ncbi:MAG: Phosphate acetyltransferase [Pelotomaculum sp. PtaB.Bin104]|nr:MAG: Phosphate acetyltransferase [Pelotomaculum sp. PtaB.Bin104]
MKSFTDILEAAKKCPPKKVAIAVAQDGEILEAARECQENGIAKTVLVGDADEIARIASERGIDISSMEVINEPEVEDAVKKAVMMVHNGEADMVMKGAVQSATVLRGVLNKNYGLRTGKVLSHVAVFDSPGYNRLMLMTDAGMNIKPTFAQKVDMVKNAVFVAKSLGMNNIKVAIIAHMELVNPDMTSSIDAGMLSKMAERGQIKDCIIDGPLALDLALSKEAARAKGVKSEVAGQADILVLDNIDAANVLYKALVFLGGAKITGLIVGASAPVILTSRADSSEAKLVSIALGVLMANKGK